MKRLAALAAAAAIFISDGRAPARSEVSPVCEAEMSRASQRHGVPLAVLFAVGLTESGRKGYLHPYALNIAGRTYFGTSARDALREFQAERARGVRLIDLGCMQINHHYHGANFDSPAQMLDPARNVDYAARFLKELRDREGDWTRAVARYHAGRANTPAQKRYVCAVIRHMVASGFGQWTPNARAFCA